MICTATRLLLKVMKRLLLAADGFASLERDFHVRVSPQISDDKTTSAKEADSSEL